MKIIPVKDRMHTPCMMCYIRGGGYDPEHESCQSCEHNVAIKILRAILRTDYQCRFCRNRNNLGGGYWGCKLPGREDGCCKEYYDFLLDWEEICKEYGFKQIDTNGLYEKETL